jgi:DNA repair exonuclease SbcCD ATPase subunit
MEESKQLKQFSKQLDKLSTQMRLARLKLQSERQSLVKADEHVDNCAEAQQLVQEVAQKVEQQVHDRIAPVVSRCLKAVFDEPYEFKIHFERKRGRTEARLVFVRNGEEIVPMQGSGGGVLDVAGFALRVACLVLARPPLRRLMILDEPFKFVSEDYRDRVRNLLETLSEEMNIQFVMITHIPELQTGKVIRIK